MPRSAGAAAGSSARPRAALAMAPDAAAAVLDPTALAALAGVCDLAPGPALDDFSTGRAREVLHDTEVLVTGWGCPPLDRAALDAAPGWVPSSTRPVRYAATSPTPAGNAASPCPPRPRPTPFRWPSTPSP